MNKIVEAVVKGQEVDKKELFNSVNDFELTRLRVSTEDGQTIMSMQVNSCKEYKDAYEFSQSCTMFNDVVYNLKKDSIEAIESEYNAEVDTLYITFKLKNGQSLTLMVINTDEVLTKDYDEMDVYQLKDFLEAVIHEKNEYYCACARISDLFGFDIKMRNTFRTYINTLDEDDWKLHISDDFISRREFINRTGVYVSALYYNIVYDKFKESGSSIDKFVETFSSNPMIQEVNLSGTFKYIVDDDTVNGLGTYDDTHEPNIWEIVNSIDMEMFHKWLESGRSIVEIMKIFKDYDKDVSRILDEIKSTSSDIGDIVESYHKALTSLD